LHPTSHTPLSSPLDLITSLTTSVRDLLHTVPISPVSSFFYADLSPLPDFYSVYSAAVTRFSPGAVFERANAASAHFPSLDIEHVRRNSELFLADPISFLDSCAASFAHTRLSPAALSDPVFDSFSDISLLREIALPVTPFFDSTFVPSVSNARIRPELSKIQPAVDALTRINSDRGEVALVFYDAFIRAAVNPSLPCSLSELWFTEKAGYDLGRLLYDYSNLAGGTPVNSDACRLQYREYYGPIVPPSPSTFISVLWRARLCFPGQDIVWAKSDVHRAYHRFRWSPQGSLLLALRTRADIVAIPITGGFGSNGPPFIYNVVTRLVNHQHMVRMSSLGFHRPLCDTFVDDSCTAGPLPFVTSEVDLQEALVVRLFGPSSAHKREINSLIDIIGVRFNTAADTVGISLKGYLKLVYLLFHVVPPVPTTKTAFSISTIQVLTSLFYRYGLFVPLLRHTASILYHALRGDPKRLVRRLSYAQLDCISSWRHFLILSFSRSSLLSTPCYDYFHNSPDSRDLSEFGFHPYCCYTDATLSTIGLFAPGLGWCQCRLSEFVPGDWIIANVEMLGLILGFAFAVFLSPSQPSVHMFVDNQNAEAWSRGSVKTTGLITNILININAALQATLRRTQTREYLDSKSNIDADAISRNAFKNSGKLTRFYVTSRLKMSLTSLLTAPVSNLFQAVVALPMALVLDGFSLSSN
jgi:hypothetical protein